MPCRTQPSLQEASALQKALDAAGAKRPSEALPLEILHNLCYQHNWTDLEVLRAPLSSREEAHAIDLFTCSGAREQRSFAPTLLSGIPPKPIYIHPNYQAYLLLQKVSIETLQPEVEYVFPLTLGQSFTLHLLQDAFDSIPIREPIEGENDFNHQDAKRLLLAMRGQQGVGGDGTVNYYVVQEGEVKPRQN